MSTRILPDTCAWIDFFRGRQTSLAATLERELLQGEVLTCGVVLFELLQGIKSPSEESMVRNALLALPHLEMNRDLWAEAGHLAAGLRSGGQNLPFSDILIAVLAMKHNCSVLTVDRHFEVVPGLRLTQGIQ